MTDLLTAAEYAAIAETLSFSGNAFIDGAFRPAASGKTFPTVNPATGKVLAEVAACGADDVDLAVARAKAAFDALLGTRLDLGQPGTDDWTGGEVSPYGIELGVTYPHADIDVLLPAMKAGQRAWRDAGAEMRAVVCLEILKRISDRTHEFAHAVMHTSGQAFMMAFQAGGPHAQARLGPLGGPRQRTGDGHDLGPGSLGVARQRLVREEHEVMRRVPLVPGLAPHTAAVRRHVWRLTDDDASGHERVARAGQQALRARHVFDDVKQMDDADAGRRHVRE